MDRLIQLWWTAVTVHSGAKSITVYADTALTKTGSTGPIKQMKEACKSTCSHRLLSPSRRKAAERIHTADCLSGKTEPPRRRVPGNPVLPPPYLLTCLTKLPESAARQSVPAGFRLPRTAGRQWARAPLA